MSAVNNQQAFPGLRSVKTLTLSVLGFVYFSVYFLVPVSAQETASGIPEIWLPVSQSEQLRSDLDAIIGHAATRRGCNTLLEAKLSDGSSEENPKFIITCASEQQQTLNLVYWSSDVANGFSEVAYEAAPSEEEQEAEAAENQLSEQELAVLVDRCTLAFRESFDDEPPRLDEQRIQVRQRGSNNVAIFMDYEQGSEQFPIEYTATCLTRPNGEVSLNIFPH